MPTNFLFLQVIIGRSEVTFVIADVIISRRHAIIKKVDDTSWSITNLVSIFVTYLEDHSVI